MPEYLPTGHQIFCGGNRISYEMVPSSPAPAIIEAPTWAELNITLKSDAEEDADYEKTEDDVGAHGAEESPEDIAARIAGDRVRAQMNTLELAVKAAAESAAPQEAPEEEIEMQVETDVPPLEEN